MAVQHVHGDVIPVYLRNKQQVGIVRQVVSISNEEGEYTQVTVEVLDEVMHSAMRAHAEYGLPVFFVHFPRRLGDIDMEFEIGI